MNTLYLDLISGISGDMFLGAMLDLGVPANSLKTELAKLKLTDPESSTNATETYKLQIRRQQKSNIEGIQFNVILKDHPHNHKHPHNPAHSHSHGRNFSQIQTLINTSTLSNWVKKNAVETFGRIARAEGKVHGMPPEKVHFHEVGAVDSIVDIVGSAIALELLNKPRVLASTITEGTGWVHCAHGRFSVPTMATLAILGERGAALSQCDEPHELITPTGAAILAQFAESFAPMQQLTPTKIGYGLGTHNCQTRPNVLRAILGQTPAPTTHSTNHKEKQWNTDTIGIVECNLDDISPEILGHILELALQKGALDAFHTPVYSKKNRPAILFTILCPTRAIQQFARFILQETTAFGVRTYETKRFKLQQTQSTVNTPYGQVPVKIGILDGKAIQTSPEYEACKTLAIQNNVPLQRIFQAASAEARNIPSSLRVTKGEETQ